MKLAVIGKITELNAIAGADRIQQAIVVCGNAGKWSGVVGHSWSFKVISLAYRD